MFFGLEHIAEDSTTSAINNIYLNGVRVAAMAENGALAYYLTDQVDSVSHVLDDAAETLTRIQYKPYGETFVHKGDQDFAPKYNSQELDQESKLYYYNARYYDPQVARFTSPDTVLDGGAFYTQAWNRYMYVRGNPIRYKDPTGHEAATCGQNCNIGSGLGDMFGFGKKSSDSAAESEKSSQPTKKRSVRGEMRKRELARRRAKQSEKESRMETTPEAHPKRFKKIEPGHPGTRGDGGKSLTILAYGGEGGLLTQGGSAQVGVYHYTFKNQNIEYEEAGFWIGNSPIATPFGALDHGLSGYGVAGATPESFFGDPKKDFRADRYIIIEAGFASASAIFVRRDLNNDPENQNLVTVGGGAEISQSPLPVWPNVIISTTEGNFNHALREDAPGILRQQFDASAYFLPHSAQIRANEASD